MKRAPALNPHLPSAHYHLGRWYERRGSDEPAIGHYRQAIRLSPTVLPSYLWLGALYEKQGTREEGRRLLGEMGP